MGASRFNNSRNPTAFTPRDLRTTIANSIPSDQAAAKPNGGLSRVWYRTLRHLTISALKAKFPCLGNQDPVDPLLQSADEILRLDPMLGKVLTSLSMAELIELHSLHLHVKKEIEPWFRDCQIPKPWIGNPVSIEHWNALHPTDVLLLLSNPVRRGPSVKARFVLRHGRFRGLLSSRERRLLPNRPITLAFARFSKVQYHGTVCALSKRTETDTERWTMTRRRRGFER